MLILNFSVFSVATFSFSIFCHSFDKLRMVSNVEPQVTKTLSQLYFSTFIFLYVFVSDFFDCVNLCQSVSNFFVPLCLCGYFSFLLLTADYTDYTDYNFFLLYPCGNFFLLFNLR
jgi:hypothetical protein